MLIDIQKESDLNKILGILYDNNIKFDRFRDPYEAVCVTEIQIAIENVRSNIELEEEREFENKIIDESVENIAKLANELRNSLAFNNCLDEIGYIAEKIVCRD